MTIQEVRDLVEAKVCCGEDYLGREVKMACGSDLMSDVLAYVKEQSVLLTGLCNPQAIRTAEMMDIRCVIFVRGKEPTEEMIELAEDSHIVLLSTPRPMFSTCGLLYENGLQGGEICERLD